MSDELINKRLEIATLNFFPRNGVWYSTCFKKPKELMMINLPCHLRDDLWLANMLKKNQDLTNINVDEIVKFIKKSSVFKEERNSYEQAIVKWQIEYTMDGGDGWTSENDDLFGIVGPTDIEFRKGVVNTLSKIGMNIDAIEEGIEKNANLWRNLCMKNAFNNEYNPVFFMSANLPSANEEFEENWIKIRKYEYYIQHKESVDKYGSIEPDMLLSSSDVIKIKEYLKQQDNIRKQQLEDCNNAKKYVFKVDFF